MTSSGSCLAGKPGRHISPTWQFVYPQFIGKAGQKVSQVGEMWRPGLPAKQLPELVIPTHETVQFNLTSTDVIHAFWIVPFEFKRDVIPGYANRFTVTPTRAGCPARGPCV